MSDTLGQLHDRLEGLRIDAVHIRGRIEELKAIIEMLEAAPRRGRPRKGDKADLTIIPQRVGGAAHEPECDEQGPLPSLDDVRGILNKENVG